MFYKKYFRLFGVRKINHLINPIISDVSTLTMPYESVYHFVNGDDNDLTGIPIDHWSIKNSKRLVMVDHVFEMTKKVVGSPRKKPVVASTLAKDYHRKNRKTRIVRDLAKNTRDIRAPLIINYAILPKLYKYAPTLYSGYHQNSNLLQTLFDNISKYATDLERNHFIELEIPQPLPTLSLLRRADKELTIPLMKEFNTVEHLLMLDIWKWLGDNREDSKLSAFNTEVLNKVNIILKKDNKWALINLGVIDTWRKVVEDEKGEGNINPQMLQKRFLRILSALSEIASSTTNLEVSDSTNKEETDSETSDSIIDSVQSTSKTSASLAPSKSTVFKPIIEEQEEEEEDEIIVDDLGEIEVKADIQRALVKDTIENSSKLEEELDINEEVEEEEETIENIFNDTGETYESSMMNKAKELAKQGLISPAEYRRYEKLSRLHNELPNPLNKKEKLIDSIKIDKSTIEIKEVKPFKSNDAILDKSMVESTLREFDSKYIKEVMHKDIMASVLNITKSGVAITAYEVDEVEDITGGYEVHTVRVTPYIGKSTTMRFRLPKIDEEGNFVSNNIKYRMRKQRADLPIRKIAPGKVALTSYYGKVFVERSDKVVNDYAHWLKKNIKASGFNEEDKKVTSLKLGFSADYYQKLPRVYSILASEFISFTSGSYKFFFDYVNREKHFGKEIVSSVEKGQSLVIVGMKNSIPIVMETSGLLYLNNKGILEEVGYIDEVIGLNTDKSPTDIVEILLFNKRVPIGIMLSYYFGLKKLIKSLPGDIRIKQVGERYNLLPNEDIIRFEDEVIIFNKRDTFTALILGSLNSYKNSLKQISIHALNRKDVYLNIFTENGLSNRYLKEMDLLRELFIDPITEEILQEMKEPTTWLGLLKRSVELLLTDYSPSEVDMEFMRIRGYERISGAVYKEMVNSMRGYIIKEGMASAAVEMNPYAVWSTIAGDPSKVLTEEINPIKSINESEVVTFGGVGGRDVVSMVGRTRVYSDSDLGVISEATTDDYKVGVTAYTTANPNFTNLRGLTKRHNKEKDGAANMVSTTMLISPSADMDDKSGCKYDYYCN